MLTDQLDLYSKASKWANDNQGVVSVTIFVIIIAFGWASGIFSALRRKPRLKLSLVEGPTFCCTYPIGKAHGEFEVHSETVGHVVLRDERTPILPAEVWAFVVRFDLRFSGEAKALGTCCH
jgi:hypothetical protein